MRPSRSIHYTLGNASSPVNYWEAYPEKKSQRRRVGGGSYIACRTSAALIYIFLYKPRIHDVTATSTSPDTLFLLAQKNAPPSLQADNPRHRPDIIWSDQTSISRRHRRLSLLFSCSQKRSPRRSAVVVTASSVVPRAPLLSEAAAESFGHGVLLIWQALQAAHSGLAASAIEAHTAAGQHAVQSSVALAEIRPLLEIDTGISMLELQAAAAA